jgi:hypothetical protein
MSGISDPLNWDLVQRQTYYATPNSALSSGFVPIPTITVAVNSYTLLIGAASSKALSHWWLAAYVTSRLLFSPSSTSEFPAAIRSGSGRKIGLAGLNLVQFPNFGLLPYLLEIRIPPWHEEMMLEIWKYSGDPLPTTAGLVETIHSVDLPRLESKINAL